MCHSPDTITSTEGVLFCFFTFYSQFHKWQMVPHFSLYIFGTSDVKYLFHVIGHFYSFVNFLYIF